MDESTNSDQTYEPLVEILNASEYPRFFKTGERISGEASVADLTAPPPD